MGLKESQAALARLLTETKLREQFFAAPEAIEPLLKLNPDETRLLLQITAARAGEMARSLQSKRRNEVAKLLPRTCVLLSGEFAPLFRQFAAGFTPDGVAKHREDAQAFAAFLLQSPALRGAPAWRRDLLRYEAVWLRLEGRRFMARLFRYEAWTETGAVAGTQKPPFSPAVLVWFRLSQKTNWRVAYLRPPRLLSQRAGTPTETVRRFAW